MTLPNGTYGDHLWGDQRFVFSSPGDFADAWDHPGFSSDDSGIGAATNRIVDVRRVRTSDRVDTCPLTPHDFRFLFVMDGDINVTVSDGTTHHLGSGDSIALPQAAQAQVTQGATIATLLDVLVPRTAER
jgi:hypothetical protein